MFAKPIPYFISFFFLFFCTNDPSNGNFTEVFKIPKKIKESSGVEIAKNSELIWTIQDSGNEPVLFGLNTKGTIIKENMVKNTTNQDWEDLTSDPEGNIYIGDFGNNKNDRQDLCIFKIAAKDLLQEEIAASEKISFYYPEQKAFPPKKSQRIFDVEAFFIFKNNFYLFTKNRSSKFDGTTQLYRVPNQPGKHPAVLLDTFKTCENFNHCAITSAAISPDGKRIVLLSSDKVWLFSDYKNDAFFKGKNTLIQLPNYSQKEGICFANDTTLYITDEKDKHTGGKLYKLQLSKSEN